MVIVAAIDTTDHATRVVAEGATLAERFNDDLHVLHVIPKSDYADLVKEYAEQWEAIEGDDMETIAREVAAAAAAGVTDEYHPATVVGDESEEILSYAADHDARYIVMGGRKRSPVGKVMFGSVAQSVLLGSDRPVLLVMNEE